MADQVYVMRHAESSHNVEKAKWKKENQSSKDKSTHQYKALRYKSTLVDRPEINIEQVNRVPNYLNLSEIRLVLCSPLRRCLSTAENLLKLQPDLRIVVEPLLTSRLSSAWSVGTPTSLLKQQYPLFDFSLIEREGEMWSARLIGKQKRTNFLQKSYKNDFIQKPILQMLEEGEGESYAQFHERVRGLRNRLLKTIFNRTELVSVKRKVLIISHSCVLNLLIGRQVDEQGSIQDKVKFEHCIPRSLGSLALAQLQPQPKL